MIRVASEHERDDVRTPTASGTAPAGPRGTPDAARHHASRTHELRWIAAAFELAQAERLRTGERIRVVVTASGAAALPRGGVDALLAAIRNGRSSAPEPALAGAYRRLWNEERELLRMMTEQLARHPAWPWLGRVRGVGPSLGARLLARLDVERAPTPSSFWAYCGLATVTADLYRCAVCGHEVSLPSGRAVRVAHRTPGVSAAACPGRLEPAGESPRRVAQPRATPGENAAYDREAKKLCYLVGTSLVRQGDAYRAYYEAQRARLDATKPDWISRRRHLTALRMTEKLFLAHLWLVWRERLGLPITAPHAAARDDAVPGPRPWSMVGT